MIRLPPVVRLGPVVQLSPEASWALWQLATAGAAHLTSRNGGPPLSPFARVVLAELAGAARHRDADCACGRQGDTSDEPDRACSDGLLSTTEAAGVIGLSPRSVQRK